MRIQLKAVDSIRNENMSLHICWWSKSIWYYKFSNIKYIYMTIRTVQKEWTCWRCRHITEAYIIAEMADMVVFAFGFVYDHRRHETRDSRRNWFTISWIPDDVYGMHYLLISQTFTLIFAFCTIHSHLLDLQHKTGDLQVKQYYTNTNFGICIYRILNFIVLYLKLFANTLSKFAWKIVEGIVCSWWTMFDRIYTLFWYCWICSIKLALCNRYWLIRSIKLGICNSNQYLKYTNPTIFKLRSSFIYYLLSKLSANTLLFLINTLLFWCMFWCMYS